MNKILSEKNFTKIKTRIKKLKVGLCHGVFDILHKGHIDHFKEAKKNCDILIVSVTENKFIDKGPNQPINNMKNRMDLLTNLTDIDFVIPSNEKTAVKNILKIKPNLYFKGSDYREIDITGEILNEKNAVKKVGGKLLLTSTKNLSSTKIINNKIENWTNRQRNLLKKYKKMNAFEDLRKSINSSKNQEVTVIGETIIDNYFFVTPVGVTSKDPAISLLEKNNKKIAGGALAVAKTLASFYKKVNFYTYGNQRYLQKEIKRYKNIKLNNLSRQLKIQTKNRYLGANRFEKLFQTTSFKENKINKKNKNLMINSIKNIKSKNLIICDYGIDLFNDKIVKIINSKKCNKFINVQTNSLNYGFNLFKKYQNYKYLSLDEKEWSLGLNIPNVKIKDVSNYAKKNKKKIFAFTMGKSGSAIFSNNRTNFSESLIDKVVDTTGCGDAYFAFSTVLLNAKIKIENISFLSNIYAGLYGQFFGNSSTISGVKISKFVQSVLKF